MRITLLIIAISVLCYSSARSEIFKYVGKDGTMHYESTPKYHPDPEDEKFRAQAKAARERLAVSLISGNVRMIRANSEGASNCKW